MDSYQQFGPFSVRIMKMERNTHSFRNPNPLWQDLGSKWLEIAEKGIPAGISFRVAYIPHIPIEISFANHVYDRLPQYKDIKQFPHERNFILANFIKKGELKTVFRLYADYQHPSGPMGGGKANVDLFPVENTQVILDLLKIAEKIFQPGTFD